MVLWHPEGEVVGAPSSGRGDAVLINVMIQEEEALEALLVPGLATAMVEPVVAVLDQAAALHWSPGGRH